MFDEDDKKNLEKFREFDITQVIGWKRNPQFCYA